MRLPTRVAAATLAGGLALAAPAAPAAANTGPTDNSAHVLEDLNVPVCVNPNDTNVLNLVPVEAVTPQNSNCTANVTDVPAMK